MTQNCRNGPKMTQKLAPAEKIAQIYLPLFASLIIPDTKYTEPNAKNMKVPFYTYVCMGNY